MAKRKHAEGANAEGAELTHEAENNAMTNDFDGDFDVADVEATDPEADDGAPGELIDGVRFTDTRNVRVGGRFYEIPTPYRPGHVLTAAEAATLNQTRIENICNTIRTKFRTAAEKGVDAPTDEWIAEYAATYEFGKRSEGAGRPRAMRDPVDNEERKLCREAIKLALKSYRSEDGRKIDISAIPKENIDKMVEQFVSEGRYRKQAEANVRARMDLVSSTQGDIADLLGM